MDSISLRLKIAWRDGTGSSKGFESSISVFSGADSGSSSPRSSL